MSSMKIEALVLMFVLSPLNLLNSVMVVPLWQSAKHIVPTGFSSLPPSGPAIPVTANVTSALLLFDSPSAISRAHSMLTAPKFFKVSEPTPRSHIFESFEYVTKLSCNTADTPGQSTRAEEINPPVHDSAPVIISFFSISFFTTTYIYSLNSFSHNERMSSISGKVIGLTKNISSMFL